MRQRLVVAALYALIGAALSLALRVLAAPLAPIALAAAPPHTVTEARRPVRLAIDSLGQTVVARDPFRITRSPAPVVYDPARVGQPEPPAPPKPTLVLVGLVAGDNPSAVIEGWPGVEGARVVQPGDTLAGLRVERMDAHAVRITGMDTVWVLTVREPWK